MLSEWSCSFFERKKCNKRMNANMATKIWSWRIGWTFGPTGDSIALPINLLVFGRTPESSLPDLFFRQWHRHCLLTWPPLGHWHWPPPLLPIARLLHSPKASPIRSSHHKPPEKDLSTGAITARAGPENTATVTSNQSTTTWVQLCARGLLKDGNSSQQFTVTKVKREICQALIICNFTHIFIYNMHIIKLPIGHEMT